jgi:Cu-processing system ATP-binding protein
VIRYEAFAKRFGDHVAMRALSLVVEPGTVVALLGPNGSGKTTSLKAAAGLIRPSSGRVLLGDPPVPATDPDARSLISFLPQKVSFPEALTGYEVAAFYGALREVAPGRVSEVLRYSALNGAGGRAVGTYSGGMVQRLGLAVALLPDAPVMLLDEPTAALDPDGLCAFYAIVERHRTEGRTVLFTSHQLGDVERLADRIAILVSGRLVANLSEAELAQKLADRGVMRVRLDRRTGGELERVRALAPHARWVGDELLVPGPATSRMAVLAAVQAGGAQVLSITAEEGRLDAFYRELVGEPT